MSTKTLLKRIALVAVAALSLGVVTSVAPASAATNFRASYTAPTAYDTQVISVGSGATVANIGTIQLDLTTLDASLTAGSSGNKTTVTVSANSGSAIDTAFAAALSLSMTTSGTSTATTAYDAAGTGYNALNNGAVTIASLAATLTPAANDYASASGKVYLNVARGLLATTDTGAKVKLTQTVTSGGVIASYVSTITLTIGRKAGTATIVPASGAGTINAGGSAIATITQPYTNVPAGDSFVDNIVTLGGTASASTFNVTAATTGGSVSLVRTSASVITATAIKDALPGSLSIVYTITVTAAATATAGQTVTAGGFTWTVQPYIPTFAYSTVTPTLNSPNGFWVSKASGGDGILYGAAANTGLIATFTVQQLDQAGNNIVAPAFTAPVTATITGKGSLLPLGAGASVTKGQSYNLALGNAAGSIPLTVYSDGTSGEGTLSITVNGVAVFSLTMKFYGDATSVTAVLLRPIGNAAGADNGALGAGSSAGVTIGSQTPFTSSASTVTAIAVLVKDANGYVIPTAAPIAAVSDRSVISTVERTFIDSGVGLYAAGTFYQHYKYTTVANNSGKSAKVSFSLVNNAGVSLPSNEVVLTLGGAVAKPTLTFDKTSYSPGTVANLTFTGLDSSGNKAYDGFDMVFGGFESSLSFGDYAGGGTLFSSAPLLDGKKTRTTYAPLSGGTWTITAYLADGTEYSASVPVVNSSVDATSTAQTAADTAQAAVDAAAEATDAANAATDAANAAAEAADAATAAAQDAADAVAALSAQVATLISQLKAQLTALTNLVIKIQKKVKA